jgi:endoglucanase
VAEIVTIGDLVTPDAPLVELMNQRVAGKAFDDRACVAIVTATLENLQKMRHTWDVAAVATVQEETGLFGASTAAYQVHPDIAVALDVGFAKQPGVDSPAAAEFNGGPQLGIGPNFHDGMNDRLREIAKRHDIKIQDESLPGNSGTDAWAIQIANEGIPCALFSLPIRNMHSTVETLDLRDIDRTARLLAHFIVDLDDSFMDTLLGDELPATTEEEA